MSSRASSNPEHQGQAQTGAQQGQGHQGQQSGQQPGGPPTNEQLIQYLMLAKGLNRETAGQEVAADPDTIKQQYEKVKQLMQSSGQ